MSAQPQTEHEWTIHSINIHGVFFERRCQKTVADSREWRLKSVNYPVEFPPPNGPFRGKESTLDIRAECLRQDRLLTLLIECKKNNPDLVNWVFFPKYPGNPVPFVIAKIDNLARPEGTGWSVRLGIRKLPWKGIAVADEARETRGNYEQLRNDRNRTKTSNAAIQDAAHQVALASKAVFYEDGTFSEALGKAEKQIAMPWKEQMLLPVIVTSAHLFTCDFDPVDVDHVTGEIAYEKASLTRHSWLLFEYPLPRHLQSPPSDLVATLTQNNLELFTRMNILVIHSGSFAQALELLARDLENFFT